MLLLQLICHVNCLYISVTNKKATMLFWSLSTCYIWLIKVMKPWSQCWLIAARAYPSFCSMKQLEVFLLLLDGMLVHCRSLPHNLLGFPNNSTGTHLYTWMERGTVRVKCLAQEHNTMSLARARTQTAHSGVKRTNHDATLPPTLWLITISYISFFFLRM